LGGFWIKLGGIMDITNSNLLVEMAKGFALNDVVSSNRYDKNDASVYDTLLSIDTSGYCVRHPEEITLNMGYIGLYLEQIQAALLERYRLNLARLQQAFDLFVPESITLNPKDSERLVADVSLNDMASDAPLENAVTTRFSINELGVSVGVEGFGDITGDGLNGAPIYLECFNGSLRACFWNDINNDDATDTLVLSEDAKLENRIEE
jgi:hypothetical protein